MTIQEIKSALRDKNEDVRRLGAEYISSLLEGKRAVSKMMTDILSLYDVALGDESWRVRKVAIEGILSLPARERAIRTLIFALESQDNVGKRNSAHEGLVSMGKRALPDLMKAAHNKDPEVRKFIADILGDIGDAAAISVLATQLLRDKDENVKVAAAEALGKIGKKDVIPYLLRLLGKRSGLILAYTALESLSILGRKGYSLPLAPLIKGLEDPVLRRGSLDALGWSRNARAVPFLIKALGESNKAIREAGLVALVNLSMFLPGTRHEELKTDVKAGLTQESYGQILRSLESYNIDVQRAAITILGWMGKGEAVLPLIKSGSEEEGLRDAVCSALEEIGWKEVSAVLTSVSTLNAQAKALVARALGGMTGEGAISALLSFLSDEDPPVRAYALLSLGRIFSRKEAMPDIINAMIQGLDDSYEEVQKAAGQAFLSLGKSSHSRVLDSLIHLHSFPSVRLRKNALELIGKIGGKTELDRIFFSLKDESPEVRKSALHALADLGLKEAVDPLRVTLADEDPQVRIAAAQTLGYFGERKAIGPLALALKDEDPQVRCAVIRALRAIRGPGPEDSIRSALSDPHPMVVITAIEALKERGEGEFLKGLKMMISHPETDVRLEAIRSLAHIQGKEAITALHLLAKDQDPIVKNEARRIMGMSPGGPLLRREGKVRGSRRESPR